MFLLCNGILVFLAGRPSCLPSTGLDQMQAEGEAEPDNVINVNSMNVEENYPLYDDETRAEDNGAADDTIIGMDNEEEDSGIVVVGQEQYNDSETESEEPASNTEELNKKIEEFIRKMKEELKLEARQQQIIAA
ncbi:hypothetical protein BVRB_8g184550 [Beta vulgaris subsp. vulgaris]|nr:hypothetical protein BVRB_8g184550 [Beta vulgaris subsp. vulgaris]